MMMNGRNWTKVKQDGKSGIFKIYHQYFLCAYSFHTSVSFPFILVYKVEWYSSVCA